MDRSTASDSRALIIFAKLPRAGDVKTRLGRAIGMDKAATVYAELAERTFRIGRDLQRQGYNVSLFYDPGARETEIRDWVKDGLRLAPQQGDTLGERMQNAFSLTFQHGAGRAIIVGTDIPDLETALLEEAFSALALHDIVLGPTADGGYYLLGMKPPAKDVFSGILWSTPRVYGETVARIAGLGCSFVALRELVDIDTEEAYKEYIGRRVTAKSP